MLMKYVGNFSVVLSLGFVMFNYLNVLLNLKISKKKLLYTSIIVLFCVGMIAALTKPDIQDDLHRHMEHLKRFGEKGFDYIKDFPYSTSVITLALYMIVGFIGWNNLLPLVVTLIFYSSVFIYLSKQKYDERESKYLSLYIIVFASFIYLNETVSGVRQPLANGVFLLLFIFDNNEKLPYNILYLLPGLIHPATLLLTVVVYTSKLSLSISKKRKRFRFEYLLAVVPYIGLLLSLIVPSGIPLISKLLELLRIYADPTFYLQFFDWRVELCILVLFLINVFIFIKNRDLLKKEGSSFYYTFYKSLLILCIGVLPFPIIFSRYFSFLTILSYPIFRSMKTLPKTQRLIITIVLVIISAGLFAYRMVNAYHYWRFY